MRHFKINSKDAPEILNLKDVLEFYDQTITTTVEYNNNPLNDFDSNSAISKSENTWYFDKNGNLYSKKFIDFYYVEIKY